MKRIDLCGKKFGLLSVVSFSHSHVLPSGQKRAMWNVVCDCGSSNVISSSNLKVTTSCGCLKKEGLNKKPFGIASFNAKYSQYVNSAKKRGFIFDLSKDQFRKIIEQPCFYCGQEKFTKTQQKNCNGYFESNGVDRIDSNKGYLLDNCVPCCSVCNKMKLDLSVDKFYEHIEKILQHLKKV
jgi:hypothetical protein